MDVVFQFGWIISIQFTLFYRYGLFASVSTILKTNMGKYLKDIVKYMIDSLQSTEGIVVGRISVILEQIISESKSLV